MKILFCLGCYLLGAFPTGFILFHLSDKKDIRNYGSRSTGATNVFRTKGLPLALPVIVVDLAKGFFPVFLGSRWFPAQPWVPLAGAFLAVVGRCYPIFIRFRGGKGVAATMGAMAGLGLVPFLLSLALFCGVIALTRYVSLGSLLAVLFYGPLRLAAGQSSTWPWVWWVAILLLIVLRHWANIRRLLSGQERRLGQKAVEVKE
ncbi:MAG TPA: glycerol-3-phosphate 1-O-acyltransferase PlsY [Acidobacteriota bacterium]